MPTFRIYSVYGEQHMIKERHMIAVMEVMAAAQMID